LTYSLSRSPSVLFGYIAAVVVMVALRLLA
jgi:hypothetical protein